MNISITKRLIIHLVFGLAILAPGLASAVTNEIAPVATKLRHHIIYNHTIKSMAFSPVTKYLAYGDGYGTLFIHNLLDHSTIKRPAHSNWVFSIDGFIDRIDDSLTIATGGGDNLIHLWDLDKGSIKHTLKGHTDDVHEVVYEPNHHVLVSGSDDKTVVVWDLKDKKMKDILEGHTRQITSVATSPDGSLIASGSRDKTVRVWAMDDGRELHVLTNHTRHVMSVDFNGDQSLLASASYDFSVRVWDVKTGDQKHLLRRHSDWVFSVQFSPDDKWLASGAGKGEVFLWDATTYALAKTFQTTGDVSTVRFTEGGDVLAASTTAGIIAFWDIASGELVNTIVSPDKNDDDILTRGDAPHSKMKYIE